MSSPRMPFTPGTVITELRYSFGVVFARNISFPFSVSRMCIWNGILSFTSMPDAAFSSS